MNARLKLAFLSLTILALSSCDHQHVLLGNSATLPPIIGARVAEVNPPLPLDFAKADYTFEEGGQSQHVANGLPTRIYVSMPPQNSDQWNDGFVALRRTFTPVYGYEKAQVAFEVYKHCRGVRFTLTGVGGGAQEELDVDKLVVGKTLEAKAGGWIAKAIIEEIDTIPDPAPNFYASRTISHMWVKIWVGQAKPKAVSGPKAQTASANLIAKLAPAPKA